MSSAPADNSAPAGHNPSSVDSSRLQQPSDAVAMDSIPEPSQDAESTKPAPEAPADDATKHATDPASVKPTSAESGTAQEEQGGETTDAFSFKDKNKDDAAPEPPLKEGQDTVMAIGPSQDVINMVDPDADEGPVCNITLLLTSGSRHPYRINTRYLNRRNVPIPDKTESGLPDPLSISVYTLKELILREWRNDWEAKPASPSSIRLIHFGKLLDDKEPLKRYQFTPGSPNVVHMSIRPPDLDEEEPKGGAKNPPHGSGDGSRRRGGGCCVVL